MEIVLLVLVQRLNVSTIKAPHTYMKAVSTRELEKILEEVFSDEIHGTN